MWAVCVNGAWVSTCAERLSGSGVRIAAVVGFPLGAGSSAAKAAEAAVAVADGATELDMVLQLGRVKAGDWEAVTDDVALVVSGARGALVKAIVESGLLDPGELALACRAAVAGGAGFVKTSTGFHAAGGATVEAVRRMRDVVGPAIGVKASGGIRTAEAALAMLAAGADRIGTSAAGPWRPGSGRPRPRSRSAHGNQAGVGTSPAPALGLTATGRARMAYNTLRARRRNLPMTSLSGPGGLRDAHIHGE